MNTESKGTIISLCDLTGHMVKPWVDAGYDAVLVDPQHPAGVTVEGRITKIGCVITEAAALLGEIMRSRKIVFVAGFPPCTDVAVSGSLHFEDKRKKDKHFQAKAALVAEQCRMVGLISGAPWFFENPVSVFSSIFGKPDHTFHPHEYTGYCAADNYKKRTCLWVGGGFSMPRKLRDESLGEPDDRIHKATPGPNRSNFRSATPMGFAIAVFNANKPKD